MASRRFFRRAPNARKRALHWTGATGSASVNLSETTPTVYVNRLLLLSADIGPGAGQVIENEGCTITRIVGTIRYSAVTNDTGAIGSRLNFGFLRATEPLDTAIDLSLESPDDLATFDWLWVTHRHFFSTIDFAQPVFQELPAINVDVRTQRKFQRQDSLYLACEHVGPLLVDPETITQAYRWDLRILLRLR